MANGISVFVTGSAGKSFDGVDTVGDVKRKVGYPKHTALVNGSPADDDYELSDHERVDLAPNIKGGC